MTAFLDALMVPLIIFMSVVAPLWIIFYYIFNKRSGRYLSRQEQQELDELREVAEKMTVRISNMEKLLDAETPDWRKTNEHS